MTVANVEFLPYRIRAQQTRHSHVLRHAYVLVFCLAALAVVWHLRHEKVSIAEGKLAELSNRNAEVRQQVDRLPSLQAELADLLRKEQIDEQLGSRVDVLDIMAELQKVTPDRIAMLDVNVEVKEMPLLSPTGQVVAAPRPIPGQPPVPVDRRVHLVVSGVAPQPVDISTFEQQLKRSYLFESVEMNYSKKVEYLDHEAREFKISCYVIR